MANNGFFEKVYNPDVLSCLANLSNDEVFTPPEVVNQMLDMLPQDLFANPDTTFLDPACKTGVFLREIAKRLIKGLEAQIPDLQERIDHIFQKQLYGIAITELTSLLSRRGVYCSKYPNSEFSVSKFDDKHAQGNIRFKRIQHGWQKGRCVFCGASESEYERGNDLETHAYEWIHTMKPEEIFKMKFDVIIGNPPYQLSTGGSKAQAIPLYNKFVDQAKKLNPRYLTMIIPSRWFAGGMGLDDFRCSMMNDRRITKIVDYSNSKDCFSGISVSGGVCYFLWERDRQADCEFINIQDGRSNHLVRPLSEFPVLVRYNRAVNVVRKVKSKNEHSMSEIISSISPFGVGTKIRGTPEKVGIDDFALYTSNGVSYLPKSEIQKGHEWIEAYKVLISQTSSEHAGEPAKDGTFKVLTSSLRAIAPHEVCTHSYILAGPFQSNNEAENCANYLRTKFARFLILQSLTSIHLTKSTFMFVPQQDFTKRWTDDLLYKKYNLSSEEIDFIDSLIKAMD